MAESLTSEMNPQFPAWYGLVSLSPSPERLAKRWLGIAQLARNCSIEDVESLLRIAFRGKQQPPPDAYARIEKAFRDADTEFVGRGDIRELELLATCVLLEILGTKDDVAAGAALAITTTAFAGTRVLDQPIDLIQAAREWLVGTAEDTRRRPDLARLSSVNVPKLEFDKAAQKVSAQFDAAGVSSAFTLAAESARATLSQVMRNTSTALNAANNFIQIQDEELQMLWWLTGGRSIDFDRPFAEMGAAALLVYPKELADSTTKVPGPRSIKGLLDRAGISRDAEVSIPDAVNGCEARWLSEVGVGLNPSPLSSPIHFAIVRRLETEDVKAWLPAWSALSGIGTQKKFPALTLAELFYLERLQLLKIGVE